MNHKTSLKILLLISKLLYPKYEPILFILYMYRPYLEIQKRNKEYLVQSIAENLIKYYLRSVPQYFQNVNNTVLVNKKHLLHKDKILLLQSNNYKRVVFVLPVSFVPETEIFCSYMLYDILKPNINNRITLKSFDTDCIKYATEIDLSLINTPTEISNNAIDTLIEHYFATPKLIYSGDILEINLKQFGEILFYTNDKLHKTENVYFKCNKVTYKGLEVKNGYYCKIKETTIKQSVNVQKYLPKKFKRIVLSKEKGFEEVPLCPLGLDEYLEILHKSVNIFLSKNSNKFKPVFLIQGNIGVGKSIIVETLSSNLGMHFYKVDANELLASIYAQIETKLRNTFFSAKMAAPCIIYLSNFEHFGKNNEGQYDERIIDYFYNEIDVLFDKNPYPVILICSANNRDIPATLKRAFLKIFDVNAPNALQREKILKWTLDVHNLGTAANLSDIANKTHGLVFEDLKALIYYAQMNCKHNKTSDDTRIREEHFDYAIEFMQQTYKESMGAPKVPKVQWQDVGGLTDVKDEIIRTINLPLKRPDLIKKTGLKRSGILLFGPPGTGKTLIAKAVATECSLCFLSVKGPELLNMYVGQSEKNVRDLFERARQASPCIIFFDELDSLAPNRGMSGDSGGVMDRVVSQLLTEMDGLNENANLFVIGATNRPDLIDSALLRPGRFDKLLYVGPCTDLPSKLSVLKAQTRKFNLEKEINLEDIVKLCPANVTGADFYSICSYAWTTAATRLIENIEKGTILENNVSANDVIVRFSDFQAAIKNVRPSISADDLNYFNKLKNELGSNC